MWPTFAPDKPNRPAARARCPATAGVDVKPPSRIATLTTLAAFARETTVTREMSVDSTERRALSRVHKQVSQAGVCNLATAALRAADSGRDQCAPSASSQPDRGAPQRLA